MKLFLTPLLGQPHAGAAGSCCCSLEEAALGCPGSAQRWLLCCPLVLLPDSYITLSNVAAEAGNSCDHSAGRFGFLVL